MDDYLLGFSLSEEDLELYFGLGWLIVYPEGVEISRLDGLLVVLEGCAAVFFILLADVFTLLLAEL